MTIGKAAAIVSRVVVVSIIIYLSVPVGRSFFEEFQGIEMIHSKCPAGTIVVRRFGDYQPRYLCKYYISGRLISAQTYWSGKSASPAKEATVIWDKSGGAIVYLDGTPVLEFGKGCFWTEPKRDS